jgi:Fur family ferric uptake transcriptional regulator
MARKPVVSNAILALMRQRHHHAWTLEDLQAGLDVTADFSSVFRAVEKLVAAETVRKVVLDDGRARFELQDAHHDHLLCGKCGELVPVPCVIAPADVAALERDTGIAIVDHHLVLHGFCRACRET